MCSVLVWLWEGILTHLSTTSHKNITYPHLPHLHISSSLLLGVTDKLSRKRSMRTIKQYTSHITHLTLHKRHHVPHHIVNVAAFCLYVSTREQISTLTHSHAHTHMYTHTYIHTYTATTKEQQRQAISPASHLHPTLPCVVMASICCV